MVTNRVVQLVIVATALLWHARCDAAASPGVKFCGRQLGEIMSRVCHAYNSPSWDIPTVVEQHGAVSRRKREDKNRLGIADECCTFGCTLEQLSTYCSIRAYSESPLDELEAHMIEDRSVEAGGATAPAVVGKPGYGAGGTGGVGEARRQVGRRSRGYGRARGRRCWCRRKRRSGRRRSSLMGTHKKCITRCARGGHRVASTDLGQNSQH